MREDQVNALKTTIRELEASLFREKEFNAASRRINAVLLYYCNNNCAIYFYKRTTWLILSATS